MKKNREKKQKEKEKKVTETVKAGSIPSKIAPSVVDRKHLHNYRVIQRNLVYVIGVPGNFSSEDLLRKAEYFGQV